jgi:molybdopterin converting factor small subunit
VGYALGVSVQIFLIARILTDYRLPRLTGRRYSLLMNVRVFSFGILKDWLGAAEATVELPEGATVAELLARLSERRPSAFLRGIAVSVNAEYASQNHAIARGR